MTAHQNPSLTAFDGLRCKFRAAREAKGWTQADLADRLGTHTITISKLERGIMGMTRVWVGKLSAELDIEVEIGVSPRSLGEKLRSARVARNMKQHEVAAALDVTVQAVSQWERNENSPTGINLLKLRALLGVEIFPESLLELRMGARPKFESEADRITAHETEMQELCVNTPSQIADAINLHKMLVAADERLYLDDGTPLANKAVLNTSWVREVRAFRILARMQCTTADEAQTKLAYFMKPAPAGDEYSNMEKLWLDAYVDEADKGTGNSDLHMDFMRSLVVAGAK